MIKAKAKEKAKVVLQPSHIKTFKFIEKYIAKNLYAPTTEEIASNVKVTGRQIFRILDDLVELGHIEKQFNRPRGLTIKKPMESTDSGSVN